MFRVELLKVTPAVAADPQGLGQGDAVADGFERSRAQDRRALNTSPSSPAIRMAFRRASGDFVYVHLEGRLEDGSLVDTTYETQSPLRFPMADLTPGWSELMKAMRPGDHWMVRMPPNLMYGAEGDGRIPPNANVIFEVRLDTVIYIDPPPEPQSLTDPPTRNRRGDSDAHSAADGGTLRQRRHPARDTGVRRQLSRACSQARIERHVGDESIRRR